MKRLIYALIALVYATAVFAKNPVPNTLKKSFLEKYPNASNVKWIEETNGDYEVDFIMNKQHYVVLTNKNGALMNPGETVTWFKLPNKARHFLSNEFKGFYMEAMLKENSNKTTHYITTFNQNGHHYIAEFSENGQVIQVRQE